MARDGAATRERILDAAERLVLERGFAGTTIDAVLAATQTTKGAFFHHFRSKDDLGRALLERYAAGDERVLEEAMAAAEAETDDPARQLVAFVRRFEELAAAPAAPQPGCLFVSFVYERGLAPDGAHELVRGSVAAWRWRILAKLEAATQAHPPAAEVDLPSLADHVFTTFEGAFILARAVDDPRRLADQLAQLRTYLELLFRLAPASA